MADIIEVADLASYLRDATVTDETASVIVRLANALVSDVLGEDLAETPLPRAEAITYEVAARAYRNPQGFSSETIDDYTYRRDAETRQAGVYLTASERAELQGLGSSAVGGFYSVPLGGSDVWTR